jgi:hypothetical protein
MSRRGVTVLLFAIVGLWLTLAPHGQAAELVLVEQRGCPDCRPFVAELAAEYTLSEFGKAVPLRAREWKKLAR